MIKLGEYNILSVIRKSDLGYMLKDLDDKSSNTEILMHFKQANKELNINDKVKVFIYADKERRLTATSQTVYCTLENPGFVKVSSILENAGVFVNINTPKDILVSKDYLPYDTALWPQVGDTLYIKLKKKADVLVGKPLNRFEIEELNSDTNYAENEIAGGYIYHISTHGYEVITNDHISLFIPLTQTRGVHRVGEYVEFSVTKNSVGKLYGKLNPNKEFLIDSDKELILNYLKDNGGSMNITAKSSSEEIENVFHISRKAFKRAYGGLYKENKIEFDETTTKIK